MNDRRLVPQAAAQVGAARQNRHAELEQRNVGKKKPIHHRRHGQPKSKFQREHARLTPNSSPIGRLSSIRAHDLSSKVDAPNAGDHSPSISAVNKTPDHVHGIAGRASFQGVYARTTGERDVPTLQFNTQDFKTNGVRDPTKGSAAHTMYTSLREMHGAGERHNHQTQDDLLDATREAYSPYNRHGELNREGVRTYRVNVHSESKKEPTLHFTKKGVDPLIAQTMINLHARQQTQQIGLKSRKRESLQPDPREEKRARTLRSG